MSRASEAGGPGDGEWRQPRVVTAAGLFVVAVVGWLLASALGVTGVTLAVLAGGVALGLVVWLSSWSRFRSLGLAGAVAATAPAGAFTAVGLAFVVVAQIAGVAPVGTVFVVCGLAVTGLGGVALVTGLDRSAVVESLAPAIAGGGLAAITAAVPLAQAVLDEEGYVLPSIPVDPVVTPLLTPPAEPAPPVGTFLLLVGLTMLAGAGTLRRLPVRELLDDGTGETAGTETLDRVLGLLVWWPPVAGLGVILAILNVTLPASVLWGGLPGWFVGLSGAVAANPAFRAFAVGLIVVRLVVGSLTRGLRAGYRRETGGVGPALAVPVGWGVVALVGWTGHGAVVGTLRARLRSVLPPAATDEFTRQADAVVAYYGEATVAVTILAAGVVVTAIVLIGLAILSVTLFPPGGRLAPGTAGGGLFLAGAFGLATGVGRPLALVAVIAGVVVWDTARHGLTLAREVGRTPSTRGVVLVHALGTAVVGVFAVGAARVVGGLAGVLSVADGEPAVALVAAGVALVVLLVVSRRL